MRSSVASIWAEVAGGCILTCPRIGFAKSCTVSGVEARASIFGSRCFCTVRLF